MRNEQHKSLQQKQNLTTDDLKKDTGTNINELVGESDVGSFRELADLDESVTQSKSNNDLFKPSLQTSVVRPLVPPGFRSTVAEKNSSATSLVHSRTREVYSF